MPEIQHTEKLTKNLSFRIAVALWKRLGIFARERETSVQAVVIAAVERYLDDNEQSATAPKPTQTVRDLTNAMPSLKDTPKAPQQ
jgi:hypothetical protein